MYDVRQLNIMRYILWYKCTHTYYKGTNCCRNILECTHMPSHTYAEYTFSLRTYTFCFGQYRHMHMYHTPVYTCSHMHYTNTHFFTLSHTGQFMTVTAHVRTSININEVMSPGCSETHVLRGKGEGRWQGGEDRGPWSQGNS